MSSNGFHSAYDKESVQFDTVNMLFRSFRIKPFSFAAILDYIRIAAPKNRKYWIDSSKNTNCPPDFYSDKYRMMCDFMRVGEYEKSKGNNPVLRHENDVINQYMKNAKAGDDCDVFLIPDGMKLLGIEHNYEMYLSMTKRVLEQHNKQTSIYRANHPDYKLIFVVFDESSLYVEAYRKVEREEAAYGNHIKAKRMHKVYLDSNFLKIVRELDCDYVLWVTPFKRLYSPEAREQKTASLALIDVKKAGNIKTENYNREFLISTEDNAPQDNNTRLST